MRNQQAYDAWNKRRREVWPCAKHSAWSSEQVLVPSEGWILVAECCEYWVKDTPEGSESVV